MGSAVILRALRPGKERRRRKKETSRSVSTSTQRGGKSGKRSRKSHRTRTLYCSPDLIKLYPFAAIAVWVSELGFGVLLTKASRGERPWVRMLPTIGVSEYLAAPDDAANEWGSVESVSDTNETMSESSRRSGSDESRPTTPRVGSRRARRMRVEEPAATLLSVEMVGVNETFAATRSIVRERVPPRGGWQKRQYSQNTLGTDGQVRELYYRPSECRR